MDTKGKVCDYGELYRFSGFVEGNKGAHDCDIFSMHGDMLPASLVRTSPECASAPNTETFAREVRSGRRLSYLQLHCNFPEKEGILCQMRTKCFGVRRVADSLAFLNTDLSVQGANSSIPSWMYNSIFHPFSLVSDTSHQDGNPTPPRMHNAVVRREGILSQDNFVPSAQDVNSKVETHIISGPLNDTTSTGDVPQLHQTNPMIVMNDEETATSPRAGRRPVTCLQDLLNDDLVSVDSYSYSESTQTPSACTAVFSPVMLSQEHMQERKRPQQQQEQKRGVFGLFGTIGRWYFKSFAVLFKRYQVLLEPFLRGVLQSCEDLYPREIDFLQFLSNMDKSPEDSFFMNPLVAWPLQVLHTISCFYITAKLYGYQQTFEALRPRGGLLASGKDIFAALGVSMSPTEEELMYHTSKMFRAAFLVGFINSEKEEEFKNQFHGCLQRSFILLVVNISTTVLQLLVDQVNKVRLGPCIGESWSDDNSSRVIPMSKVKIARVISTRSAVVCGHPTDLERLSILLVKYASATGVKVHREYLPTATPENSSFYNQSQYLGLLQLWSDNGIEFDSSMLQLTVYSPVDGESWNRQSKCVLTDKVALAVTSSTQDLTYSLQHLCEDDVLLDFSADVPSLGQLISWSRHEITMLVEPVDRISVNVFPSPRRSALDGIIHATLEKCAKINIILQSMYWENKPQYACIQDLSTSFIDLALLVDAKEFAKTFTNLHSNHLSSTCDSVNARGEVCSLDLKNCLLTEKIMNTQLSNKDKLVIASEGRNLLCDLEGDPTFFPATSGSSPVIGFNCILLPNENLPAALNMYQLLPVVRYYEMQFNSLLTQGAVEFAQKLAQCTGLAFPPHTLLMCPTVLALMELWDTYDFLRKQAE